LKIFVLLSRIPYPLEKGDKLRAYHQLLHLSKENEIILCCLNDGIENSEARIKLEQVCKEVHFIHLSKFQIGLNLFKGLFNKLPFQVNYFYHANAQKLINNIITQSKPDRIYCQLIRTTEYVKHFTNIPKTLDYMDVFSKGIERRINSSNFILKPFFKKEYKRLVNYEKDIFDFFERKIIISNQDRNFIQHPQKQDIKIIANGVDVEFFKPRENINKTYEIVFTGNMNYPPNIDAAVYLSEKILPKLHHHIPSAKLLIAGSYPSLEVLAQRSDYVHVSGWVDDIRDCYASSKIFIAPMQIGTGLQNKLLEAMSMKLPCITSPLANNALVAINGKQILLAENIDQYVNHILTLLNYPDKAKEIAENGFKFVHQNYLWSINNQKLQEIICG
jgi:sugar transferase (PEP-CTERM/EpsH1 system associated)